MELRTNDRLTVIVGDRLSSGGEGEVFDAQIAGVSERLAFKRYFDSTLKKKSYEFHSEKVAAMVAKTPSGSKESNGHVVLPWPTHSVFEGGRFVGFLMPRISFDKAAELHIVSDLSERASLKDDVPKWVAGFTWMYHVSAAANLAHAISTIHGIGPDAVFGDFNSRNILIHETSRVTLVDCDAIQIRDEAGRIHVCNVVLPDTMAPEFRTGLPNEQSSDLYTLGFHIHQLLLAGERPFGGVWSGVGQPPSSATRAKQGDWVYRSRYFKPRRAALDLSVLPKSTQRLFERTFVEGARNPERRPSAHEWASDLRELRSRLTECSADDAHIYWTGAAPRRKQSCPWCAREKRLQEPPTRETQVAAATQQLVEKAASPIGTATAGSGAPSKTAMPKAPTTPQPVGTTGKSQAQPPAKPNGEIGPSIRAAFRSAAWIMLFALGGLLVSSLAARYVGPDTSYRAQPHDIFMRFTQLWLGSAIVMSVAAISYDVAIRNLKSPMAQFGGSDLASAGYRNRLFFIAAVGSVIGVWLKASGDSDFFSPEDWWSVAFLGALFFCATISIDFARAAMHGSGAHGSVRPALCAAVLLGALGLCAFGIDKMPTLMTELAAERWSSQSQSVLDAFRENGSRGCRLEEFDEEDSIRVVAHGAIRCRLDRGTMEIRHVWARSGSSMNRVAERHLQALGNSDCTTVPGMESTEGTWTSSGEERGALYCWRGRRPKMLFTSTANDVVSIIRARKRRSMRRVSKAWLTVGVPTEKPSDWSGSEAKNLARWYSP